VELKVASSASLAFAPVGKGTSDSPDVVLPDGLSVQFWRTSIARLFGKQEAGWQRPTSSDSFFNLPRYNTKQRVSPIMSLTSNLLDWWSPFPQQQFSKCYPLLIHAEIYYQLQQSLGLNYLELAIGSNCELNQILKTLSAPQSLFISEWHLPFSLIHSETWKTTKNLSDRTVLGLSVHPPKLYEAFRGKCLLKGRRSNSTWEFRCCWSNAVSSLLVVPGQFVGRAVAA
jgi:hypothetical protein